MNTISVPVRIHASRARVWEALTDPAQVKQYFFGTKLEADWRVGGKLFFRGEWDGKTYEDRGTIEEIIPNERLVYSYWTSFSGKPDLPENRERVSYRLREINGDTELTVEQEQPDPSRNAASEQNWNGVFSGLKALIEG